jgi:hypothetical protein
MLHDWNAEGDIRAAQDAHIFDFESYILLWHAELATLEISELVGAHTRAPRTGS